MMEGDIQWLEHFCVCCMWDHVCLLWENRE